MRDLYHRHVRLVYWIQRVNIELQDPDRTDVLRLIEHMDNEMYNSFTINEKATRQTIRGCK
jgi:hypothetical protein